MKTTQLIWNEWWQNLTAVERFRLMKKHNVSVINSKTIKKMYNKENI